jgi:hypothetical protein
MFDAPVVPSIVGEMVGSFHIAILWLQVGKT